MNLSTLKKFAAFLNQTPYLKLRFIKRIGDNLFKLDIGGEIFYFDLSRGRSMIFMAEDSLVGHKIYNAPFDKSLQKFCWNSWIKQAKTDGNNRILQLFLELQSSYKTSEVILNVEFTGRNTNLILLDTRQIVLDALRHITSKQSFREVHLNKKLLALPQPKEVVLRDEGDLFLALKNNFSLKIRETLSQKIMRARLHIEQKIAQLQRMLQSLEKSEVLEREAEEKHRLGQKIINNLYLFPNFRGREIVLQGESIGLPEDSYSLVHAAQIFFKTSQKFRKKAKNIYMQEVNIKEKIEFYERLLKMVQNVTNLNDLEILNSYFYQSSCKRREKSHFESFFIEGVKVSIGKNKRENILLLKEAKAEDLWLHVKDIPGSHCIIHCGKSKVSNVIIQKAAEILVGFSKGFSGNYAVDYTKRKFVKIIEGANVIYAKAQRLNVLRS